MGRKKNHDRGEDQTQISVSLSQKLLKQIDELAAATKRSRSNWIVTRLEPIVDAELARKKIALLPDVARAAEGSSSSTARLESETPPEYRATKPSSKKS